MASEEHGQFLFRIRVTSNPELLSVVRSAVERTAACAGLGECDCRAVTLAVDEAITNIVRHAYENRPDEPIELTCVRRPAEPAAGPERVEFLLVDRGRGVEAAKMRGRSLDEVRPGGLGTHFIREIMDEVEYVRRDGENQLRLVKYLPPQRPA